MCKYYYIPKQQVCRTIGDIEAKSEKYGGNHNVVISEPEITLYRIKEDFDFILLASDGLFDRLNNEDITNSFFKSGYHSLAKSK